MEDTLIIGTIVAVAIGVLVSTSGIVVAIAFRYARVTYGEMDEQDVVDTGRVIGKFENVLVFCLMLLEAYTALGVIFAAKSLVRRSDMSTGDTSYYLTGTIANFTYSVVVGGVAFVLVQSVA